ncbi:MULTISPECIES: hypothetical protein [unclassified Spirosoma]|uniref:Uncharacterized protein n=1 Tax=Spirosoma linguale (strain ATCC 33905 / DSM 74 / LMG 10896 / Claus 1) TaxID=504472 RepID=D2QVH3_SPILD|nr:MULTISPECIES: hypothetical protein [unclassified Spirosoma]ADB42805.1 hypothetical protein Slin_6856 [Spirosoma linguale DSM 74]MBN8827062.1 hypothetical protein [Spirosoma sp.]OJW71399.1 MAG: hypothetical protein BGO59_19985 [Spirosoma sp. 48-14]
MVRLRLEGETAEEVKMMADTIESVFPYSIGFSPVQEGKNPRYAGQQKFFSYATVYPATDSHLENSST